MLGAGLLLLAPALVLSPTSAYRVAFGAFLSTIGIACLNFLWIAFLPDTPVSNGPVGATCPDTDSGLGDVQSGLAIAAMATATITIAAAIASAVRGNKQGPALLLAASGSLLPYIAIFAWAVPRLCDYS